MKRSLLKKLLLVSLGTAMILSAVACKKTGTPQASEEDTQKPEATTAAATTAATTADPNAPLYGPARPGTVYDATELSVAEHLDDVFRPLGRNYVKNGRFMMDFSCAGIHFLADCEGDIKVQVYNERQSRFTVYVDGQRMSYEPVAENLNGTYINIATKLERGVHEIRIVNQTQFIWAQASFGNVRINGEFVEKPNDRQLFLEFYGDSILNGSNVRMNGGGFLKTDATQAFGWLTAENLNADMSLIGCSSIGLTKNSRNFVMKDLIGWSGAHCTAYAANASVNLNRAGIPEYDFARIPDAVIIEQGVNDGGNAGTTAFKNALTEMISTLRAKYGNDVPIVVLTGYTSGGAYNTAIPTIINDLGGENAGLYVCKLSNAAASKDIGGDGTHPNIESSKKMAEELSAFLGEILEK